MENDLDRLLEALETGKGKNDRLIRNALAYFDGLRLPDKTGVAIVAGTDTSSDAVLGLIEQAMHGWSIHATGKAFGTDGHWTCSLRRSSSQDNDDFIGIGRGPQFAHALLAAALRTGAYLAGRKT